MKSNEKHKYLGLILTLFGLLLISATIYIYYRQPTQPQFGPLRNLVTTNTNRLAIVNKYCPSSIQAVSQSQKSTNQMYNSSLSTFLKANATKMINDLAQGRFNDVIVELQVNGIGTFVFIVPYIIGLVLMLLAAPFFLCCCLCQDDCPVGCCRGTDPYYSTGDLTWVTVVLIVIATLLTVTAIPAMTNANNYFQDFNCRVAQFFDNFQNGNQTSNQLNFFSGISTIRDQFSNVLSPALSGVKTQIDKLTGAASSPLDTAKTSAQSAKTSMSTMPDGTTTLAFTQTYNQPLQSSPTTGTFSSLLGPKVGIFSDSTTLLGDIYAYTNTLQTNLTTITTAASGVSTHLTAGDMGARITAMDTILADVQSKVTQAETKFDPSLEQLKNIDSYNVTYSFALYGTVMGLSLLALLGVIFVKCFNMIGCRYLLHIICLLCFILGIILFALATFLSVSMASTYYSCIYFSNTFTDPNSFTDMINNIVGSQYSNISTYFSQCFGGTNDFITVTDATLSGYVTQLKTSVFNSKNYNFTDMTTNINTKLSALSTQIDNTGLGHIPDFDTTTASGISQIAYFNTVADKSLFTSSCPSGSFNIFWQDVWVPGHSTSYQNLVSCQGKVNQDATTCSSGIASTGTCPSSRCMNTFSIISWYYRNTNPNMVADSNTRYGTCAPFTTFLTNFQTNYVQVVNDNIGNSAQDSANNVKLAGRYNSKTKTPVQSLALTMTSSVQPLFSQVYNNLTVTLSLDSVFNPDTGVFTGLDCRLLSQSGVNLKESLCVTAFNRIFFNLVLIGIMAFSMFLMVCCLLCFNVRHYQYFLQQNIKATNNPVKARGRGRGRRIQPLDQTDAAIQLNINRMDELMKE